MMSVYCLVTKPVKCCLDDISLRLVSKFAKQGMEQSLCSGQDRALCAESRMEEGSP